MNNNQIGKTIIDADTFARCMDRVVIIRANDDVTKLLMQEATDFEMDSIQVFNEKYLDCKLNDFKFGLKGYVDKYIVDDESKTITIVDLKTTAKPLESFAETVDFYNYWLQAAIYSLLVIKNVDEKVETLETLFWHLILGSLVTYETQKKESFLRRFSLKNAFI